MDEPRTREQMEDTISERAREHGYEPWDALRLAQISVDGLIASNYLREWGFNESGEVLYEKAPRAVIYIVKEK